MRELLASYGPTQRSRCGRAVRRDLRISRSTAERKRTMVQQEVRQYELQARSTETFGRVLCSARTHHFVVDGPLQNSCPGEAITPGELFLSGVAACGVELVQVLARAQQVPLQAATVAIRAVLDPSKPVRPGVSLFNAVRLHFHLKGVTQEQGVQLIEAFKRR